ncbi:MAG: SUMF1/EgtB/PvdO family nonheme iron enzyme [Deltaproteobacteria bacterium]|nr:SUMF1/EgtB/PvdO family nonheme iron enzyme [Deltaproteobacteria bacterium]
MTWSIAQFAVAWSALASLQAHAAPTALPCGAGPEGMACIAGGPFVRGTDGEPVNARPKATVWVQTYWMDLREVTFGEYKACERKGKCPKAGPKYSDFNRPKQAMTGVNWFDARAYCQAAGKRLPTEAEWEKAARGPDGALHPWGDEPATCKRAVIMDKSGRSCGVKKLHSQPEKGRVLEVATRPAGAYGLFDMSGNSWEWVADWYSPSYGKCGAACAGQDPKGPCAGADRCPGHAEKIVRGGSWYWPAHMATGVWRRPHAPGNEPFHHFGFRCAKDVAGTD